MAAFAGRQVILQLDGTPIASMTTKTFEINKELIDTSSDDSGAWVQKLETVVGSNSVSISGSGVMTDEVLLTEAFATSPSATLDFIFPTDLAGATTGPTISGTFLMASFSVTGENADKHTFDVSFESSDEVIFTAGV